MLVLLCVSPVYAEEKEQVLYEAIVAQGGLICDSVDEVKSFITVHEAKEGSPPSGCGVLQKPLVVRVVIVGVFETARWKYLLVRYELVGTTEPPQFGVGAVKDKGEPA